MGGIPDMPVHILKMDGPRSGHGRDHAAFGRLGDPAKVSARVQLRASDPHAFSLARLDVRAGQTVEIILHNAGRDWHELVIGDSAHQAQYSQIVRAMPDTRHEHDNALVVDPGQTRSIVWEFGDGEQVELACHIQDHYEKGMVVRVTVHR